MARTHITVHEFFATVEPQPRIQKVADIQSVQPIIREPHQMLPRDKDLPEEYRSLMLVGEECRVVRITETVEEVQALIDGKDLQDA